MSFPLAGSAVVALLMMFLGLFTYHKGRHQRLNTAFLIMILTTVGWLITASLADAVRTERGALILWKLAMIGPILFCPIFLYFCALFPDGSKIFKKKDILFALPPAILLLLVPTPWNIKSVQVEEWGTWYDPGVLYNLMDILLIGYVGIGITILIKKYRRTPDKSVHIQIRLLIIATVIMVDTGLITNSILPRVFDYAKATLYGPSFSLLSFTLITSYAILRFRLMKMRVTLRREMLVWICFALLALMMGTIIILAAGILGRIASFLFSVVFVLLAPWIHKRIAASVMNTFPIENIDFAEFFDLNKYRISISYLEPFLEKTKLLIRNEFGADGKVLIAAKNTKKLFALEKGSERKNSLSKIVQKYISEKSEAVIDINELHTAKPSRHTKKLLKNNVALIVPACTDKRKGALIIHNKPFGKSFTAEEKNQLSDLAHSVALTIEQIQTFERSCLGVEITKHRLDTGVINSKK